MRPRLAAVSGFLRRTMMSTKFLCQLCQQVVLFLILFFCTVI